MEICSACHPFYTGRQKLVDTGGRVERFQRRVAKGRRSATPAGRLARGPAVSEGGGEPPLTASRDAPVGGQAVLEGVMMRGVSNWAVAVRKLLPEVPDRRRIDPASPSRSRLGRRRGDRRPHVPAGRLDQAPARLPLAGDPRRRGAGGIARHRPARAQHLGERAAARGAAGDLGRGVGGHGRDRARCSRSACSSWCRSA